MKKTVFASIIVGSLALFALGVLSIYFVIAI